MIKTVQELLDLLNNIPYKDIPVFVRGELKGVSFRPTAVKLGFTKKDNQPACFIDTGESHGTNH